MSGTDGHNGLLTGGEREISWFWASVLAIQPVLTTAALLGFLLFALISTATTSLQLPDFLPLIPGALALIFVGAAHLYTPIYLAGLLLDLRKVRKASGVWTPSWWFLLGGGAQIVYFIVPVVQASGVQTFEELVFGTLEVTALFAAGVITTRYLRARDSNLSGAPTLVSFWSSVWSRGTPG
jgi:hypothetical protein